MRTYKFLAKGARGPLFGFAWPPPQGDAPGAWIVVEGALAPCARGVHVCRPFDLAHWIHDELWEVEAEGDSIEGVDCLVVARARLVRPVAAWSAQGARDFADACVEHAAASVGPAAGEGVRELLEDARFMVNEGYVAVAAYTTAMVAGRAEGAPEVGYRRERAWQSAWIAERFLAR